MEVDGIRQNILLTYGKLTEGPVDAWKAYRRSCYCRESSQKVSRLHGKLTEVDRRSSGRTKHFRKVPRMHEILTEYPGVAQKADGSSQKFLRTHGMLMEGPADAQQVDGKSSSSAERLRMVLRTHDKFTDLMVLPEDAQ